MFKNLMAIIPWVWDECVNEPDKRVLLTVFFFLDFLLLECTRIMLPFFAVFFLLVKHNYSLHSMGNYHFVHSMHLVMRKWGGMRKRKNWDNKQIRKLFTPMSLQDLLQNTLHLYDGCKRKRKSRHETFLHLCKSHNGRTGGEGDGWN